MGRSVNKHPSAGIQSICVSKHLDMKIIFQRELVEDVCNKLLLNKKVNVCRHCKASISHSVTLQSSASPVEPCRSPCSSCTKVRVCQVCGLIPFI